MIKTLLKELNQGDSARRKRAIMAFWQILYAVQYDLTAISPELIGAIPHLINAFKYDVEIRREAEDILVWYGAASLPALINTVKEGDRLICGSILTTLWRESKKTKKLKPLLIPFIPDLLPLLQSGDYYIRAYVVRLLGVIGDKSIIPDLELLNRQIEEEIALMGRDIQYSITEYASGWTTDIKDSIMAEIKEAVQKLTNTSE
ncbi:MAG: hypothetical protein WC169_08585 [Dehalococcoidia bacterium]|jgi:HEAT repeat protein